MKYKNPILSFDCSDPDVLPYKKGFLMITSSFHFAPGLPLYYSEDLVNWKLVRYIFDRLPTKKYRAVHLGHGIWAPSIREHNGIYYVVVPFPDEGIYVSESKNPLKSWSKPRRIWKTKGIEDPCPIWIKDKAYLVVAFIKSRIGFNSKLGLVEVDSKLRKVLSPLKIIYDGTKENPTIEGPKFYHDQEKIMILAPAGGVEHGYQIAMKASSVFGPYEYKVILKEFPDTINGPHQGALVEYKKDKYVFFHFQDDEGLGRILHLQPVTWINGWPIPGEIRGQVGAPIKEGEIYLDEKKYPIQKKFFIDGSFPLEFQYPCNPRKNSYQKEKNLFFLNAIYQKTYQKKSIQNCISTKIPCKNFVMKVCFATRNLKDGDEGGLLMMGEDYSGISIKNVKGKKYIEKIDEKGCRSEFNENTCNVYVAVHNLRAQIFINEKKFGNTFVLTKGNWVGHRIGIYAFNAKHKKGFGKLGIYFVQFDY